MKKLDAITATRRGYENEGDNCGTEEQAEERRREWEEKGYSAVICPIHIPAFHNVVICYSVFVKKNADAHLDPRMHVRRDKTGYGETTDGYAPRNRRYPGPSRRALKKEKEGRMSIRAIKREEKQKREADRDRWEGEDHGR